MAMGDANSQIGTAIATIAGGTMVLLGILWRGFSALRRSTQSDTTDAETLKLLEAAVAHWRNLYDTAWDQVRKERQLREAAEDRVTTTLHEVEALRAEVAELQRKIDHLTSMVRDAGLRGAE